jgi:pimeloyl-ACP methyl ester carboxylesterase
MAYIEIPGARLWYEDSAGAGTPVVLLHAASGTADCWEHQVPAFIAAGYRCVTYDRRGWGRSTPLPNGEQPGYGSVDLLHVADALGIERFHLVATAAGGVIALDFTVSHPERVRSLVMADSIGGVQDEAYVAMQERVQPPEFRALPVELRELGPAYRATNPDGVARWLEIEHATMPDGKHPVRQKRFNRMSFALLEALSTPVLLLGGDADMISPPPMLRGMAEHLSDGQFINIPEAGHAAFWEQPDIWNGLVLDFVGGH